MLILEVSLGANKGKSSKVFGDGEGNLREKKREKKNWGKIELELAVPNPNRSPKGIMWSAIPVALLHIVVYWIERQGSGPKGDKVL